MKAYSHQNWLQKLVDNLILINSSRSQETQIPWIILLVALFRARSRGSVDR